MVVCLPFDVQSETSRTLRFRPGWITLSSELLPTPLWPETAVTPWASRLAQAIEAPAVGGRGHDGLVAELGVKAHDPLVEGDVDQVGLVEDDDGADPADLGGHQVAVDQAELEPGLGQGRDDEHGVDVGRDDVLAVAIAASDHSLAGLDLLDQPFLAAGAGRPEPDPVADGDHVPALDGQALEQPPHVAGERPPVVGLDEGEQAVDADDATRQGRSWCPRRGARPRVRTTRPRACRAAS